MQREINLLLGKQHFILRPSFESLNAVEKELGSGLIALAHKLSQGELRLDELCVIMRCTTSCETALDVSSIATLILNNLTAVTRAIAHMFAAVIAGKNDSDQRSEYSLASAAIK